MNISYLFYIYNTWPTTPTTRALTPTGLVRSAASLRFANKEKEVVPWGDMVSLMVPQGMFTRTKGLLGLNGV